MGYDRKFWKVDLSLLPIKIHFFLFLGALACVLPFRTVFAKQLGISATAVGVIFLAVPFMKIVTNPLFGLLTDYFKKFRLIISFLMTIVAVTHVAMVYIPPLNSITKSNANIENDIRIVVNYNCIETLTTEKNITFDVLVNIKVKLLEDLDFSCEMDCNDNVTLDPEREIHNTNSPSTCGSNASMQSHIVFKTGDCNIDFGFDNKSVVTVLGSEKILIEVESKHNQKREKSSVKRNCSSISDFYNLEKTLNHDVGHEIKFNETSNFTSISELERVQYRIGKRFVIKEGYSRTICPCEAKLSCDVKDCKFKSKVDENKKSLNEFITFQFWALFLLMAVSSTSFCAVLFLVDAVCYEMLPNKAGRYGYQRLWGTIGWGLGALAGGYVNQILSEGSIEIDYTLSFYLLAVLMVIDLIPVSQLDVVDVKYSSHICKDVCFLLAKPGIMFNFVMVFIVGILSGIIWNYQFWFMEEIGASQVLLGLSQVFECIFSEVPCFLISGWLIKRIGYINCNSLTLLCLGLRYICFAYMYDPWMSLPAGLLCGPTFGTFYASMTMYGKTEAPPGTEATVQSLLAMCYEGVGVGLGSILGGIGFDQVGSRATFLYAAIASFLVLIFNVLMHIFCYRKSLMEEKPKTIEKS